MLVCAQLQFTFLLDSKATTSKVCVDENKTDEDVFKRFTSLKKTFPHLLTLLSVGGWQDGSLKYSLLAANSQRRKKFAENSVKFLRKFGFDGMNFYWDHPVFCGTVPEDKENYVELLREIKEAYDIYLTTTVRTAAWMVHKAYAIKRISKYVDYINLISFDHSGCWSDKINFQQR